MRKKIKKYFSMNVDDKETANDELKENNAEQIAPTEEQKMAEMEAKLAEVNDKYLRLYSDFENFRKRTAKEKMELISMASEQVFKSFLPVIDDLERALKSAQEAKDIVAVTEGVQLIYHKLKTTLNQKGLEEIKSLGEIFNTDYHEAITNVPAATEDLKGKVVEELEKGYLLNGKVIRFAKVVVGN